MTNWLQSLQLHEILIYGLAFGLPIVAIGFSTVAAIVKSLINHRERMAMIEHGLAPEYHPKYSSADENAKWSAHNSEEVC